MAFYIAILLITFLVPFGWIFAGIAFVEKSFAKAFIIIGFFIFVALLGIIFSPDIAIYTVCGLLLSTIPLYYFLQYLEKRRIAKIKAKYKPMVDGDAEWVAQYEKYMERRREAEKEKKLELDEGKS